MAAEEWLAIFQACVKAIVRYKQWKKRRVLLAVNIPPPADATH